jgi:hypothetical protein
MLMQDQIEQALCRKHLAFIVGAPRSGTTWLQLLLSRSPAVATSQETDLFNIFLRPIVDEWKRYRATGLPRSLTEVLSDEEIRSLLRHVSVFVFAKIAQARPCATLVLEKTPNHASCWREILDLWPDAHFIHIIRDPRSVVASRRAAVKSWGRDWGSSSISTISEVWIKFVSEGRQIRSATDNYQEVTYHELISDGPAVVMRLLGKLGIPSSLTDCQRYVEECSIEKLKAAKLDNAPFDISRVGKYRFRLGVTDSWRSELSATEIALVERLAESLMLDLGFERVTRSKVISAFAAWRIALERLENKASHWLRARL